MRLRFLPSSFKYFLLIYADRTLIFISSRSSDHSYIFNPFKGYFEKYSKKELVPLRKKIHALNRLGEHFIASVDMELYTQVDEVNLVLDEFSIPSTLNRNQLYSRLRSYLNMQQDHKALQRLTINSYRSNIDFIHNVLMMNLGPPDKSENYYNKLRLLLHQILENIEKPTYIEPEDPLIGLSKLILRSNITNHHIVLKSNNGLMTLPRHSIHGELLDGDRRDLDQDHYHIIDLSVSHLGELIS